MRQTIIFTLTLVLLMCAACSPPSADAAESLPSGDAGRGAALFTESIAGAPACSTCHTLDDSTLVGPSMKGFSAVAGTRITDTSAVDYTYNSILHPAAYIVSGFSNLMYTQYAQQLTPQETADLVAYLLTL